MGKKYLKTKENSLESSVLGIWQEAAKKAGELDEAGKSFHVLLLKSKLTLPYTTVFLQLDCGYWSNEAEQNLRRSIETAP